MEGVKTVLPFLQIVFHVPTSSFPWSWERQEVVDGHRRVGSKLVLQGHNSTGQRHLYYAASVARALRHDHNPCRCNGHAKRDKVS